MFVSYGLHLQNLILDSFFMSWHFLNVSLGHQFCKHIRCYWWFISSVNNNNSDNTRIIFLMLSSNWKHCEGSPGSCDECSTVPGWCRPLGQADRLNHKPACRLPVNYTHHRQFIITQSESWYSFYQPTKDRRLSRQVPGYIPRWFTCPHMVTHPSTNRAQRRVTTLIETNALLLSHVTARVQ